MAKTNADWEALRARAIVVKQRLDAAGFAEGSQYIEHQIAQLDAMRPQLPTISGDEQDQFYTLIDRGIRNWEQKLGSPGSTVPGSSTAQGSTPAQQASHTQTRINNPAALFQTDQTTPTAQGSVSLTSMDWWKAKMWGVPRWALGLGGVAVIGGAVWFFRSR